MNKIPQAIEVMIPPKKPTRLLFGLAAKIPLVLLPKRIPKNQAPESHINTRIKYKQIKIVAYSFIDVSLVTNVIINPL